MFPPVSFDHTYICMFIIACMSLYEFNILEMQLYLRYIYIYIFVVSVSLCVYYSCSPLPGDQPWQVGYQEKAHTSGKAEIMS